MIPRLRLDVMTGPSAQLIAGRSLGFAASFAIPIVLARVFDPSEFGSYKQLFLIFATLYGLAQLGMAESLYYFLPRHGDRAGRLVANATVTLALGGLISAAGLVLARQWLASWLSNPALARHLVLLGIFLALMLASAALEILLIARGKYTQAAWTYALSDTGKTVAIVLCVLMFRDLESALAGAAIFAAIRLALAAWRTAQEFRQGLLIDVGLWRKQLAYALPFALAVSLELAQASYHQFAVAARVDAATFAIFAVGCLQIPLVDVIATSAANVLMVRMAEAEASGRTADAVRLWHETMSRIAMVIFPVAVLMVVAAHEVIVTLFTATYAASVPIFKLWTLTIVPSVLCVDAVLRVQGRTRTLLWLNIVRLGGVVALIGWGLSAFGLAGGAVVVLVATVVSRGLGVAAIARGFGLSFREALPWRRLAGVAACAVAAAAPLSLAPHGWSGEPWAVLLSTSALYVASYAVLCFGVSRVAPVGRPVPAPPQTLPARLIEG